MTKAHKMAKDAERALDAERKQTQKRELRRMSQERKEQRSRERDAIAIRKSAERAARESTREDRRRKKLDIQNVYRSHKDNLFNAYHCIGYVCPSIKEKIQRILKNFL